MGYLFLLLTIVTESTAVIFMKLSHGFENKWQGSLAIAAYILSFVFLTLALKQLPAGTANAIWAGASTVLVALVGAFFLKEQVSTMQWLCISLIVIGIIGLNVTGNTQ
jgi:multidrug transporter EmrE-like cation transporter